MVKCITSLREECPARTIRFFISAVVEGKSPLGAVREDRVDGGAQAGTDTFKRPQRIHQLKRPVVGVGGGKGGDERKYRFCFY